MIFGRVLVVLALLVATPVLAGGQSPGFLPDRSLDPAKIAVLPTTGADQPPKFVSGKTPVYPISLLLSGKGGSCEIEFTVGTDGRTKDFEVVSHPGKMADHAIIAISSWIFEPATKDGVPVEARIRQAFAFNTH